MYTNVGVYFVEIYDFAIYLFFFILMEIRIQIVSQRLADMFRIPLIIAKQSKEKNCQQVLYTKIITNSVCNLYLNKYKHFSLTTHLLIITWLTFVRKIFLLGISCIRQERIARWKNIRKQKLKQSVHIYRYVLQTLIRKGTHSV